MIANLTEREHGEMCTLKLPSKDNPQFFLSTFWVQREGSNAIPFSVNVFFLQLGMFFSIFFLQHVQENHIYVKKLEIEGGSHKLSLFSPTFLPKNVEIYNSVIVSSDRAVWRLISPTTHCTLQKRQLAKN